MVDMIQMVTDHIFKDHEPIKNGLEDVIMRGNLLKLKTDVIIENTANKVRTEERENGIRIMISALKPYTTHEQITKQLIQSYNLSLTQAEAYIRKYTQS